MRVVNLTVELPEDEIVPFEHWLGEQMRVIDFRITPDTKQLYEDDIVFRNIVRGVKKARDTRDKYINDKNGKDTKQDN